MKRAMRRTLVISAALAMVAGCAPKPKEHRELPPGVAPAPVTQQDTAATRNAEPGNQKKER